jgi:hypothetical protein
VNWGCGGSINFIPDGRTAETHGRFSSQRGRRLPRIELRGDRTLMKTHGCGTPILELARLPKPVRRPSATKAEAEAMDREVVRIVGEIRSNWLRLGSLIQRMIDTRAFEQLGFANMRSWMTARLGESTSNAFSALRSVRALRGVPEEKLKRIGERNAHMLTYLSEKDRRSDEWLEKAATVPTKEFKRQIEIALNGKTGLPQETFKTWSIALPEAVYEAMCQAEKKLAWSLEIDMCWLSLKWRGDVFR